jgi:4-amino-4-deoxychorismate lyase
MNEASPCLPLSDRGFLFGDGVFSTVRIEDGSVFCWDLHKKRLFQQCQDLGIEFPNLSLDHVAALLEKNDAWEGVWRLRITVTGGLSKEKGLPKGRKPNCILQIAPYTAPEPPSSRLPREGISFAASFFD